MSNRATSAVLAKALNAIGLARERVHSNLKADETLVFFNTCAWQDAARRYWNIPIHGWVYEAQSSWAIRKLVAELLERKYGLKTDATTAATFKQRLDWFTADNERKKSVIINLQGQLYELPKTQPNGQFEGLIKIPVADIQPNHDGLIRFEAVLKPNDARHFDGDVALIAPEGVSVISDIDDTIKVSYINDRKRMFDAAFFREFIAVKGMPELYQRWQSEGAKFHFVSSSPWQLYSPLKRFAEQFNFPWSSFSLKKVRVKDETLLNLFKSGLVTKPIAIRRLLKRYPARKFILVGDSSEQDAEVYAQMAKEFPEQIVKILIRNVDADDALNQRFEKVFKGLKRRLWSTFVYPSQIKFDINKVSRKPN